jgi:hypothetical protein
MKGMWWNSDGFADTAKHCFIHETIREHKLDFVVFMETGRANFSAPFLRRLSGGLDYMWYCLPPHGRSGGILVGVNVETISIQRVETGDFCVKLFVKSKFDGFEWILIGVYGAAQDALKPEFLSELVRICDVDTLPMLVGGDFNIIRRQEEKNNDNFKAHWPFLFNAIIESLDLREIELSGRQYTWASRRENPTYEKLDRPGPSPRTFVFEFQSICLVMFDFLLMHICEKMCFWHCILNRLVKRCSPRSAKYIIR